MLPKASSNILSLNDSLFPSAFPHAPSLWEPGLQPPVPSLTHCILNARFPLGQLIFSSNSSRHWATAQSGSDTHYFFLLKKQEGRGGEYRATPSEARSSEATRHTWYWSIALHLFELAPSQIYNPFRTKILPKKSKLQCHDVNNYLFILNFFHSWPLFTGHTLPQTPRVLYVAEFKSVFSHCTFRSLLSLPSFCDPPFLQSDDKPSQFNKMNIRPCDQLYAQ